MALEIKQIGLTREAWGPRFWKILHTLTEQSGNQTNQILSNDEADAWILLLKAQPFVMPCALCKQHFLEWLHARRPETIRTLVSGNRKDWIRNWLWGCHDRVNSMNQKKSPDIATLPEVYRRQSIEKPVRELFGMFQQAMMLQQLKPEDVAKWKKSLAMLRTLYGI
jgi:hypothetical protein